MPLLQANVVQFFWWFESIIAFVFAATIECGCIKLKSLHIDVFVYDHYGSKRATFNSARHAPYDSTPHLTTATVRILTKGDPSWWARFITLNIVYGTTVCSTLAMIMARSTNWPWTPRLPLLYNLHATSSYQEICRPSKHWNNDVCFCTKCRWWPCHSHCFHRHTPWTMTALEIKILYQQHMANSNNNTQ